MLTKQKAQKVKAALVSANKEAKVIFNAINGRNTISSSLAKKLKARVKDIETVSNKVTAILVDDMKTTKDVIVASRIGVVDKLLTDASSLKAQATILRKLIAEGDEFSQLPDANDCGEDIEADDVESEGDADNIDAEDEVTDDLDNIDAEDEVTDDLDNIDAEDEVTDDLDNIDAEDEVTDDTEEAPITSNRKVKRKPSVAVKASRVSSRDIWNFGGK